MTKERDTYVYELKRGNEVCYVGKTNNPDRREQEHQKDGKKFGHMKIISRAMTEDGAEKKEKERLEAYRKSHRGKNPEYNKG